MMREIKFRAWVGEEMIDEDYNDDHYILTIEECTPRVFEWHDGDCAEYAPAVAEIMQYTGLKDKNGKEIYEGDIVRGWCHDRQKLFIVKFNSSKYTCGFIAETPNGLGHVELWYEGYKVIGNIHENPELLVE